jgi:hypothetical protein
MSKLSSGIAYTQVKTTRKNWQIVVVAGVPIEFRQLCILMLSWASGNFRDELRNQFHDDTMAMWRDIKWLPGKKVKDDEWDLPFFCMKALKAASSDTAAELDLLPLAQQISRELHEAVTL